MTRGNRNRLMRSGHNIRRMDRFGDKLQESNKRGLEKDRNAIAREKFLAKMRGEDNGSN